MDALHTATKAASCWRTAPSTSITFSSPSITAGNNPSLQPFFEIGEICGKDHIRHLIAMAVLKFKERAEYLKI